MTMLWQAPIAPWRALIITSRLVEVVEVDAKKGIIKLMLLLIRGNINIESPMVLNITSAPPSKGMQVVLNQPCAA
jgi:hypothetical protein